MSCNNKKIAAVLVCEVGSKGWIPLSAKEIHCKVSTVGSKITSCWHVLGGVTKQQNELRVRFFGKIQIRILVSKNGFCVPLPKSENGLITD